MPISSVDTLRRKVAVGLRRVAGRVEPHRTPRSGSTPAAPPSADLERLLHLLFPVGVPDHVLPALVAAVGDDDVLAPSTARRVLGLVDQQTAPSPVVVRFGPDDVERVEIDGITLVLDRADASVSVQIRDDGGYEPHVAAVLDDLLQPGHVFVDVGANVGYHAARAAARVGSGGRVVAVEANPENARLLALTRAANHFDHLDVVPLAVADRLGFVHFGSHIGSNGGFAPGGIDDLASGRGSVVPCVRLDDLGLERVDVIKIDVEGAEPIVLAGAVDTIARCRPAIVFEFSCEMTERVGGIDPGEHLRRIVDLGYTLHVIDRAGGPPIAIASVAELLATWGSIVRLEDFLALPTT